ncbi:DUF4038 domain-containing protein [Deinococcus aestuarii]|uniref:apiosidase-like domain-containing protein n=1 Tax=Deinococcus aestuarii TaxID=2774531 RepID=UPI001FE24AC7|nr:DUF4038 domain-containing protein [Deinococcus aestuarii]
MLSLSYPPTLQRSAAPAVLTLGLLTGRCGPPEASRPSPASDAPAPTSSSLTVSPEERRLQCADRQPFLYCADTGWELFHRLGREDVRTSLQTRASQGFTDIQAVALAEMQGLTVPNAYGGLTLVGKDPAYPATTPGNDPAEYDHWDHADSIVDEAASLGLQVALLPTWDRWVNDEPIYYARLGPGLRCRTRHWWRGATRGNRLVVGLRGEDYAWVYLPDGGSATVTPGRAGGAQVRASWLEPRTGQTTVTEILTNTDERPFSAPSSGRGQDWVLLIETTRDGKPSLQGAADLGGGAVLPSSGRRRPATVSRGRAARRVR